MSSSLANLGPIFGTDKAWHDYLSFYDEIMMPFRDKPIVFLEQGILGGNSVRMWDAYFSHPDARIWGIDIEENWRPEPNSRVITRIGSQANVTFLARLVAESGPLDIICDDAGHWASQQIVAFKTLWPSLNPGGLYIIEDLHCYASPQHNDGPQNIMEFITGITFDMQPKGAEACAKKLVDDPWYSIDTITFRKGVCVIRKMK